MAIFDLKTTMAHGELTPLARQRQDLELYRKGLARMFNWFVLKHGGGRRRPGTRFRGTTKFMDSAVRLFSYTFSIGQSYILEFGQNYMRVWVDGGQVAVAGPAPFEMATPYPATDVGKLQYAPYNDNIYVAHGAHPPQRITRILSDDWAIAAADFIDGPYLPVNDVAANTVTCSVAPTTGSTPTCTFSSGCPVSFSASLDIGRHIRIGLSGTWAWGKIASVISAKVVVVDIIRGTTAANAATAAWRLGAFYVGNYPSCVSFFEDRLCWSGCPDAPRTVHSSYSGLPATYSPTDPNGVVTEAHGFSMEIGRSDPVLWLKESSRLQLGTASGIRSIGGSNGAALTAINVNQRLEVKVGATEIVPEQVGQATVFAGRTSRRLNRMYYDYQVNGLVAPELSILSEHLFKNRVVGMAYQETPDSLLWACDQAGKLISTTIDQDEEVKGFAQHDVGGFVTSVATLQLEDRDELWLCVRRTINGSQFQYIETLAQPYDEDTTSPEDAFFVDCGGTYSGAATNTITGVSWLVNEEVELLADGARLPNAVVSGTGVLTLPNGRTASKVQFGKSIPNKITTLEAPGKSDDGASLGRRKRAVYVLLRLLSSQGVSVGDAGKTTRLVTYRNAADLLGASLPLNTGTFKALLEGNWSGEAAVDIEVVGPFPATVLALNVAVESEP